MAKPETRINDESRMAKGVIRDIRPFDLDERTALFGEAVIAFARGVPADRVTAPLITQLVRAATSIGSNYCEADDAESKKDFRHKIGICRKESRETKHWLRMIVAAEPSTRETARGLWQEAKELNLIFGAIWRSKGNSANSVEGD